MVYSRWIEVNLDHICHNFFQVKQLVGEEVKIMAVVKANAYGHGAVAVAKALEESGVDSFAVTTIEEGVELRTAGVDRPILVFSPLLSDQCAEMKRWNLIPSIDREEALLAWAERNGGAYHLKVDTGMHRIGASPEEALHLAKKSRGLAGATLAGIYSHLATAQQQEVSASKKQIAVFQKLLQDLRAAGIDDVVAHLTNSAGTIKFPEARGSMVRIGTLLYGQYPADTPHVLELKDPWQAKARLVEVKMVAKGEAIGYGGDYRCTKNQRVGVIPFGYADGFNVMANTRPATIRSTYRDILKAMAKLTGKYGTVYVKIKGKSCPVIGRIGMQLTSISLDGVEAAYLGAEVNVPLRRTTASLSIPRVYTGEMAAKLGLCQGERLEGIKD